MTSKKATQRQGFKTNEFIVYPAHGVGQIVAIEEQEVAGYKLELFVNLRIIETACARKGITVTDAEIDAAIRDDLKTMNLSEEVFRTQFLKQYNKNLIEWREDVIRPRLLMSKLGGASEEKDVSTLFRQLKAAAKPKLLLEK